MEPLKEIAAEIKKRRKFLGINQDALAEISGVSLRSLKSVETGKGNPGIEQLSSILNALGLKLTVGVK